MKNANIEDEIENNDALRDHTKETRITQRCRRLIMPNS